ncbi:MAG: hypothetical protein AAFY28_09390 [Actinomycetota bacterium]
MTVLLDQPCRMRDTRPNEGVGGRTTPLGPGEAYTVQGTGVSGDCNVPADAVGLVGNVTAVDASEQTNLRLYPTGGIVPTVSNLNPSPGAPPAPNAVTVGLDGSGQFDVRNANGNVHIVIDVSAYLVDHNHDDRYPSGMPTSVRIPMGQFIPNGPGGGWEFTAFAWVHSGADSCIGAPVQLPEGASVDSVVVSYIGAAAVFDVDMFSTRGTAGPADDPANPFTIANLINESFAFPPAPGGVIANAAVAHDPADVPALVVYEPIVRGDDYDTHVRLCTPDPAFITSVLIDLTYPS